VAQGFATVYPGSGMSWKRAFAAAAVATLVMVFMLVLGAGVAPATRGGGAPTLTPGGPAEAGTPYHWRSAAGDGLPAAAYDMGILVTAFTVYR
jgi:hypothetical protein